MPFNIAIPKPVPCTSRFHVGNHSGNHSSVHSSNRSSSRNSHSRMRRSYVSTVSNSIQYVCHGCKARWAEQTHSAESYTQDLLHESLEAAQTLIQLADAGRSLFPNTPRLKRGLDVDEGSAPRECKRQKVEHTTPLPPETLSTVWSRCLDSDPKCALDMLAPDWRVCDRDNPLLGKDSKATQVVTYTRGIQGAVGNFSTTFGHGDGDHIFLPTKTLDDRLMVVNSWSRNESIRSFFQEGAYAFQLAETKLPANITGESFISNWRDTYPIRGEYMRNMLPFDDETPIEKKLTPNGRPFLFKLIRHLVVNSPLTLINVDARSMVGSGTNISKANLEALDNAIDLDRTSHLWLSWSQMPQLESVLLDLRIYSHDLNTDRGCISKEEIIERAKVMGRWLRLKLLVIAGLQSYSFTTTYESYYTANRIEQDGEIDGEPNWIKMFMPAVRPGGKLVLVDRQIDGLPELPERTVGH